MKVPKDEPANQTKILQLFRGEAQALSCVPLSAPILFTSSLLRRLTLSDTGLISTMTYMPSVHTYVWQQGASLFGCLSLMLHLIADPDWQAPAARERVSVARLQHKGGLSDRGIAI